MSPDARLILVLGLLHLAAMGFLGVLLWMAMKSEPTTAWDYYEDEDDGDDGGGNDRILPRPKSRPPGGIPLPDAAQSSLRLRGPGRLADVHVPERRRTVEPERTPVRVPAGISDDLS